MRCFIFSITFFLIFFSCTKKKCSESESIPVIEYNNFVITGDSAIITINFEDCNGDIGSSCKSNVFDLFLTYIEVENGKDTIIDVNPPLYYCLPPIDVASTPAKGTISVKISPLFYRPGGPDTIKYKVLLRDVAGNWSNAIITPPIYVPQNKK